MAHLPRLLRLKTKLVRALQKQAATYPGFKSRPFVSHLLLADANAPRIEMVDQEDHDALLSIEEQLLLFKLDQLELIDRLLQNTTSALSQALHWSTPRPYLIRHNRRALPSHHDIASFTHLLQRAGLAAKEQEEQFAQIFAAIEEAVKKDGFMEASSSIEKDATNVPYVREWYE